MVYSIENNYDKSIVEKIKDEFHKYYNSKNESYYFDFPLTCEWGESAKKLRYVKQIRRYVIFKDNNPVGLFQGIVKDKYFIKFLSAGSNSGNGLIIHPDYYNLFDFFLNNIMRENNLNFNIFTNYKVNFKNINLKENYTYYINLSNDIEYITDNMHKSMRKSIKNAEKNNVIIEINTDKLNIKKAYNVIEECSKERRYDVPGLEWWEHLYEEFINTGQIVSAIAYYKSNPISAYLFIGYDKKINAFSSGSLPEGYRLRANHLLNFKIIEWAKREKYELLDMGGTNPYDEKIHSIDHFKADFGGVLKINYILEKQSFYFPLVLRIKNVLNL